MMQHVARRVVRDALRVTEDDVVGIYTWRNTIDIANEFAAECFKVGADVLTVLNTDKAYWDRHRIMPADRFRVNERLVAEYLTAEISLKGPENPQGFKQFSHKKSSALYENARSSFYNSLKKKVRVAFINFSNVTSQRAEMLGFDYIVWKKMMDDAINVPYRELAEIGEKVQKVLKVGKEVHVTSKEGTDITFQIGTYPVQVDDGVISEEDLERGNCITNVPAGEVLAAAVEDSAEGRVIGEPFYRGRTGYRHYHPYAKPYSKLAQGLKLTFSNGRVKSFEEVEPEAAPIKPMYEGARGDKDRIGWLCIGINPKAKAGYYVNGIAQGAVTIGVGANKEIGGKNDSGLGFGATMTAATVKLDGKVIVKNGELKL